MTRSVGAQVLRVFLSGLMVLSLWHTAAMLTADSFTLVGPVPTFSAFFVHTSKVLGATADTIMASLLAFALASCFATLLLVLATAVPLVEDLTVPVLVLFRSAPVIVLAPIIYSLLGGDPATTRIIVGILISIFPLSMLPLREMHLAPHQYVDAARAMGARPYQIRWGILLPWSVGALLQGLRVGVSLAVIGVVVSEMVYPNRDGIGRIFIATGQQFQVELKLAALLSISLATLLLTYLVENISNQIHRRIYGTDKQRS